MTHEHDAHPATPPARAGHDGGHAHGDGHGGHAHPAECGPTHSHGHGHHHGPGGHSHVPTEIRFERPLWWALGLTATVLLVEIAGAWLTNSLALLSDAAHMATDTLALAIALVAVRLARRPAMAWLRQAVLAPLRSPNPAAPCSWKPSLRTWTCSLPR